jgi:hypothetical protein
LQGPRAVFCYFWGAPDAPDVPLQVRCLGTQSLDKPRFGQKMFRDVSLPTASGLFWWQVAFVFPWGILIRGPNFPFDIKKKVPV